MSEKKEPRARSKWKRIRMIFIASLMVFLLLFISIRYYYPYGEGVKTGQLNFVVYKGMVFKTYEGKLIQTGFWTNESGNIQSNEFNFSITDPAVADSLMKVGGQVVELHYKQYFGTLPWRGYSKYIVDHIVKVAPSEPHTEGFPLTQ